MSLKDQSQADGFVVATVCSTGESYMRLTQDGSTQPRASRGQLTRSAWNGAHAMGSTGPSDYSHQPGAPRPVDPLAVLDFGKAALAWRYKETQRIAIRLGRR